MSETPAANNQCAAGRLWYPGLHLDQEYPVPSDSELCDLWKAYSHGTDVRPTKGVYGVYDQPGKVRAVASIDLCEVVRDTAVSLDKATGVELGRRGMYSDDTWFDKKTTDSEYERSVVISVVRAVMDSGLIEPVEGIGTIRSMLQKWRSLGVYCVANTSTLPGCERGTITHTLQRDLPGCFDGLVLPRNHDGNGSVTKAQAIRTIADESGIPLDDIPLIHIDDAVHHISAFEAAYSNRPMVKLFAPVHRDNHAIAEQFQTLSPVDAFREADKHFEKLGVI